MNDKLYVGYVAAPYRAKTIRGIVENIRHAEKIALDIWALGYPTICPHKNTALFDGAAPDDVWLRGDLELLNRCDFLVYSPNSDSSAGARAEIEHARFRGIPVFEYVDMPTLRRQLEAWQKSMRGKL